MQREANNIRISKNPREIFGESGDGSNIKNIHKRKDEGAIGCFHYMKCIRLYMKWSFDNCLNCDCFSCYLVHGMVSKKKKRLVLQSPPHDFNFDMTYITTRIIAMAYPSGSKANFWRNFRPKIAEFFEEIHDSKVKVYNLCIEKGFCIDDSYRKDFDKMHLKQFQCLDHEPHKFLAMFEFNIDALIYLSKSAKNVISVHCKAGKGRTGLMIWSLLIFLGFNKDGEEAYNRNNNRNDSIEDELAREGRNNKYEEVEEAKVYSEREERLRLQKSPTSKMAGKSFTSYVYRQSGKIL